MIRLRRSAGNIGTSAHLTRHTGDVGPDERRKRYRHKGGVVWLTGLSGSGKSTIASRLERTLFDRGVHPFVLDGDNVRQGLCADLGFSAADRVENIRRVAETAKLFAEAGIVAITAFISPYRSERLRARRIVQEGNLPFCEVFVDAPLAICEQRDPKGLYAKARTGEIALFTGISAPYEPPDLCHVRLRTHEITVDAAVAAILDHFLPLIDCVSPTAYV